MLAFCNEYSQIIPLLFFTVESQRLRLSGARRGQTKFKRRAGSPAIFLLGSIMVAGGRRPHMEITRGPSTDGTFCPAAADILGQIPTSVLFFAQHQLRHPESIYSFSLEKVGEAFIKLAEAYLSKMEEYRNSGERNLEMTDLLSYQEGFLRALQEHLDDCYLILKTLVDPSSAKRNPPFAEKYVVENKLPGAKSFQSALVDYKRTLRIANKLKHQQGRLRGVAVWLPSGAHLGYFMEAPDADGHIAPSEEIHPGRGCVSFARDVTWHLFNVYLCSEKLAAAVATALSALHGTKLRGGHGGCGEKWDDVVSLACRIPPAFFPRELRNGAATFRRDAAGQTLVAEFPVYMKLTFPHHMNVTCSTVVDGHSPSS